MSFHLAQLNVARMRAPLEDPVMAGFVARLDEINALADQTPGFVWRLQTDDGDATSIRAFEDELVLVNMSVWESVEALKQFVFQSRHVELLRARRDWFEPSTGPYLVMWWIEAGHIPSLEEAKARLDLLAAKGPSPDAFTFRTAFPAPSAGAAVKFVR